MKRNLIRAELSLNENCNVEAKYMDEVQAPDNDTYWGCEFTDIVGCIRGLGANTMIGLHEGKSYLVSLI